MPDDEAVSLEEMEWRPFRAALAERRRLIPLSWRPTDQLTCEVFNLEQDFKELRADLQTYREMLSRALGAVRALVKQRDQACAELRRVHDQYTHLREQVMRKP